MYTPREGTSKLCLVDAIYGYRYPQSVPRQSHPASTSLPPQLNMCCRSELATRKGAFPIPRHAPSSHDRPHTLPR